MSNGEPTLPADDELELLRGQARSLGMPSQIDPENIGVTLPSAKNMLERAKAADTADEQEVPALHRKKNRRLVVRALAAAAAVAGIATIVASPWQQHAADASTPPVLDYAFANAQNIAYAPGKDARAELNKLAETASQQTKVPGSGSIQYLLTDNWFAELEDSKEAELIPKRRETWLRADGSLRARETSGTPLSPDGRGLTKRPVARTSDVTDETYPADDLYPQFVAKLGTDVQKVRDALMRKAECEDRSRGPSRAACLYQEITGLYASYVVPPTIAATFWRILADEPTMRSLGSVKDRAGRAGIGISFIPADSPQFRRVLIISSETGQLIGTEDILIKKDPDLKLESPAIYSFTAILDTRYTRVFGPDRADS
ncbi:CU044_5270 family protein [Aeromicrobium sp. Root344]|uniref:CU044_5270 family protein n=1 Tax=Aeromicrobium sp. Root344 TaxID=1736521 RepID=UPI000ADF4F1B|nr:CU044_5270 family protein [Aeromicrobium sp. Root344]